MMQYNPITRVSMCLGPGRLRPLRSKTSTAKLKSPKQVKSLDCILADGSL